MRLPQRQAKRSLRRRDAPETQLVTLKALAERIMSDVARLGLGEPADLDYMAKAAADALRTAYADQLATGYRIEADFGDTAKGEGTFTGDGVSPVEVVVHLHDRSALRDPAGRVAPTPVALWTLRFTADRDLRRVLTFAVTAAS